MSEISMYEAQKKKMQGLCDEHDLVYRFEKDRYPIIFTIKPVQGMDAQISMLENVEEVGYRSPDASMSWIFEDGGLDTKVRFYENAEPFEEKRDELTISGWVYDEYHLELNMYDGLSEDILGNYAGYLAQAKLHEAEGKTIPSLQQQVADLETDKAVLTEKVTSLEGQVTDTQMALCDVYEQIVAVTSTTGGE